MRDIWILGRQSLLMGIVSYMLWYLSLEAKPWSSCWDFVVKSSECIEYSSVNIYVPCYSFFWETTGQFLAQILSRNPKVGCENKWEICNRVFQREECILNCLLIEYCRSCQIIVHATVRTSRKSGWTIFGGVPLMFMSGVPTLGQVGLEFQRLCGWTDLASAYVLAPLDIVGSCISSSTG